MRVYLIIVSALLIGGCVNADMGLISMQADKVQIGYSQEQVIEILGKPKVSATHPDYPDISYLHFCNLGIVNDDDNGFFFYKGLSYQRIQSTDRDTRDSHGVYEDFSGPTSLTCAGPLRIDWKKIPMPPEILAEQERARTRQSLLVTQEYLIDGLVVSYTHDGAAECATGSAYRINISGAIGPDSSFALDELLKRSPHCRDQNGNIIHRTMVTLSSGGGLLEDGYIMGRLFRSNGIRTYIEDDVYCASSCAVAYLGGLERGMGERGSIMFHSPYLPGVNALGERVANCDIGTEASKRLLEYYQEMTSIEQGSRLMDRTLSYCSATDGWLLKGYPSAELFGVATNP